MTKVHGSLPLGIDRFGEKEDGFFVRLSHRTARSAHSSIQPCLEEELNCVSGS